jgi:hypothetical protein
VLELKFNPNPVATARSATGATSATSNAQAPSETPKKVYIRYNVNSPQGQVMLAKYARAIDIMRTLPDYDTHSWNWWWYTHWVKGPPSVSVGLLQEKENGSRRVTPTR